MVDLIRSSTPLLRIIVIGAFIAGIIIAGIGIVLVFQGDSAETEFSFFGQTFKSQSVGIAAIFIGASVIVLLIRRSLKSMDLAIHAESKPKADENARKSAEQTMQDSEAKIILNLSEEIRNKNITFGLLHVRDGKDQIDDKGPLLNKEIYFKELDRHGTFQASVKYAKHIGFQFKCFIDYKGTSFDEIKTLLIKNKYESIGTGGGKQFRAWFILPEYETCLTIDGITNNFFYPA